MVWWLGGDDGGWWVVVWRGMKGEFVVDDGCGSRVDYRFGIPMFVGFWSVHPVAVSLFKYLKVRDSLV